MIAQEVDNKTKEGAAPEIWPGSAQFLQATLDALSPHIALLNVTGTIIAVNAAWRRFAEANHLNTSSYGVGMNYLAICERTSGPGQAEAFAAAQGIRQVIARQRETFSLEYPCHSPEEERWFILRVSRIEDSQSTGVMVIHESITARKQSEAALLNQDISVKKQAEERYISLVNAIEGIVWEADARTFQFSFVSRQAERLLGYPLERWLTEPAFWVDHLHPDDRKWAVDFCLAATQAKQAHDFAYRMLAADGRVVWLRDIVTVIVEDDQPVRLQGIMVDITECKRAEETLCASESSLAEAQRLAHLGNWERDIHTNKLSWSDEVYRIFGVMPQEFEANYEAFISYVHPEDRDFVKNSLKEALSGGKRYDIEHRIVRPDGTERVVHEQAEIILNKQGEPSRIIGTVQDITERKQAERALQEREKKLHLILDNVVDGIITTDERGVIKRFNRAAEKIFGYAAAEVLEQNIKRLMPEFYSNKHDDYLANYHRADEPIILCRSFEVTGQRKDGSIFPMDLAVSEYSLDERKMFIGIVRDITERKERERALQESEARYKTLFNALPIPIFTKDCNGHYTSCNLKNLEYWPQNPVGHTDADLLPPEVAAYLRTADVQVMETGQPLIIEERFPTPQGCRYVLSHKVPLRDADGNITGILGGSLDITEHKQAEEALRQHEAQLQRRNRELALLNQVIAASATASKPEVILETACRELALVFDVPQAAAALLNEEKTASVVVAEYRIEGQPSALKHIIPVEGNPVAQYILNHKAPLVVEEAQSDPRLALVRDLMRQRGTVSLLIVPLVIAGEVVGTLGLDVIEPRTFSTEEVNLAWRVADEVAGALARARHSRERRLLSAAVEQSAEGVIVTDTQETIVYINPAFEQASGYSRAEVLGQTPNFVKSNQQDTAFYEQLKATISAGQVWHGRLTNKKKDGKVYTVDAIITPVRDEKGTIVNYVSLQRDITRELQLEEQLRQSQKMEAIGRLAGGVAHDFNNILTVIAGYVELLLNSHYSPDDPRREDIGQIKRASERATMLTRQLLAFSRQQPFQPQLLSLKLVVTSLEEMLRRLIGEHIALTIDLTAGQSYVKADPGQIEQIIMNLTVNARDAMPGGGKLILKVARIDLDQAYASRHLNVTPGPYVMLAVTDTGVGMDAETQSHIFEPFFTTKGLGKGTGLGLSIVYGIVEQSGGHIEVESTPGQGTAFKIYLPRVEPAAGPNPSPVVSSQAVEGSETILLLEDEAGVRLVVRRFLQKRGYRVLEASHAEEALRLCQQHEGRIDLFITDIVMPDINGPELAKQLVQLYPGLKVLYISGYSDDMLERYEIPLSSLLTKPFSSEELGWKVRELLDRRV